VTFVSPFPSFFFWDFFDHGPCKSPVRKPLRRKELPLWPSMTLVAPAAVARVFFDSFSSVFFFRMPCPLNLLSGAVPL